MEDRQLAFAALRAQCLGAAATLALAGDDAGAVIARAREFLAFVLEPPPAPLSDEIRPRVVGQL